MSYAMLSRKGAATPRATTVSKAAPSNLRIGEPNDFFELEADRVADEVMDGAAALGWSLSKISVGPPLQRKCDCGGSGGSAGQCEECEKKETLQRRAIGTGGPSSVPPIVHEVLNSPGQPLDSQTRSSLELSFGHDFSNVRVHTDARAHESARAVNALAYTVGNDLVFSAGQFAPETKSGRRLLAHELAHVVQQQSMRTLFMQRQHRDAEESDGGQDEVFAALYSAIYSGMESLSPTILLTYADSLGKKYEEAQATGKTPKSQVTLASILMRIYGVLQSDEQSAERDADGALLAKEFGGNVPWASSRPHSVSEIPLFSTEHILAWQGDAAIYERQHKAVRPGKHTKQRAPTAPPGFNELVESSSAAPAPAQASAAQAPSQVAPPAVQVQERTSDEKDYAKDPGGGQALRHGINVLKGHTLSSLTQPQGAASGQATARANDPTLLDASAQIWFISNRLYLLDRTGHLQAREEPWFDVSSVGGMKAGGVYFIQLVHEQVGSKLINFRGVVLEGLATSQSQFAASINFPRVLTALIPMLEMSEGLAKQQAGVGIIIAPSFGKRRLTVSDISLDKLLRALDRVPRNLPWAINAEFNRIQENPLGEAADLAMAMGMEYLSKFAPVVGQVAMAYQLLELAKWLGEVGNVAAYAQTDDEIDLAAQAIARKLAQYLVFEAISRSVKGGVKLAGRGAAKLGEVRAPSQAAPAKKAGPESSERGKPHGQEEATGQKAASAAAEEGRSAAPGAAKKSTADVDPVVADTAPSAEKRDKIASAETADRKHEALVTKRGVFRCSDPPCPVIHLEYAKELAANPELKRWNEAVQNLRKSDPAKAAEEGKKLIDALEQVRSSGGKAGTQAASQQRRDALSARIAEAEGELNPARQATITYQQQRKAAGRSLKGGPIKGIWNVKERIWILKRQRAFPDRTMLEQARIVGVKGSDGQVKPSSDIVATGRIPDFVELRGSKVVAGDLKSAEEFKKSIEGGLKKPGKIEGEFRGGSKVGGQHEVEKKLLDSAQKSGGKIVIEGANVLTGETQRIEVSPQDYDSEVLTYEEVLPN